MTKRHVIYLRDHLKEAVRIAKRQNSEDVVRSLKPENIEKSAEEHARAGLRYNSKTGTIYIRNEWRSRPVRKEDIEEYENITEILEWQLASWILNGASRLERGFKSIG